jgi:hypothetical protein
MDAIGNKTRAAEIERYLKDNFPIAYMRWLNFILEYLIVARRTFDGDLDALIILGVVGQRAHRSRMLGSQSGASGPDLQTNASSISETTGIPRQTVRRKLADMEAKGWIAVDKAGRVSIAFNEKGEAAAGLDLRDLTDFTMHVQSVYVDGLVSDFEQAMRRAAGPGTEARPARTDLDPNAKA